MPRQEDWRVEEEIVIQKEENSVTRNSINRKPIFLKESLAVELQRFRRVFTL